MSPTADDVPLLEIEVRSRLPDCARARIDNFWDMERGISVSRGRPPAGLESESQEMLEIKLSDGQLLQTER